MLEADSKPEGQQGNLYEKDFYAWTQEQVDLLRHHKWHQLDLDNLIDEIESLGKQQRQELRNHLSVLIQHLLKWEYQQNRRTRSWLTTIRVQRSDIINLLDENPSLAPALQEIISKAYSKGVDMAVGETGLAKRRFPTECPYSLEAILNNEFYPGSPSELVRLFETDE